MSLSHHVCKKNIGLREQAQKVLTRQLIGLREQGQKVLTWQLTFMVRRKGNLTNVVEGTSQQNKKYARRILVSSTKRKDISRKIVSTVASPSRPLSSPASSASIRRSLEFFRQLPFRVQPRRPAARSTPPSHIGCRLSKSVKPSRAAPLQHVAHAYPTRIAAPCFDLELDPRACVSLPREDRFDLRPSPKTPPRRGARRGGGRGGRGAGCGQPEEQPAVQAANLDASVTYADLAAMEQRYQDMLQAALATFLAAQ
ncbi:hypothetical protein E6C27_scaffold1276G00390 [Cucumis melo var. makuwa]|uniref:Gag protease polyprotein n=1 Tax=Cucumis melo var. makuwa TaxID=1194695 RepID=A0A5A7SUQ0_CUCMM|nr:hypothetical protein E6C27_scaffold1276G00390 [Cucumis melo var. makuwa]